MMPKILCRILYLLLLLFLKFFKHFLLGQLNIFNFNINNQVAHVQRMDIFQLIGDFLHLIAVLMLLLKILANKNVIGLSYRTQQIFLVVFLSRYLDLFLGWKTLYAFVMKIVFISLTGYTIYLMKIKKPYNLSLDRQSDAFPHYYIYGAALLAAIIIHKSLNPIDFLWSFSIWLQALAILPQLFMIYKLKDIQNITAHYVLFLGLYRGFYIFHWIFHWQYVVWTSFIAGIIQTILYGDFIYYFVKSNQQQRIMSFPV